MQQVRYEGSLLASLSELKAIEEQRVAEERAARERVEQERVEAIALRARHEKEAAEAKARAEHEAQLAVERARVEAEREGRLRVEAAEAAERARQQAELERMRLEQEHELRRAEVAKKRPTWMVAVTAIATLAAGVLIYVAVVSRNAEQAAITESEVAIAETKKYQADVRKAREQTDLALTEMSELDGRITAATAKLKDMSDKAEIAAAQASLKKLNQERIEKAIRVKKAHEEWLRLERLKGVHNVCNTGAICKGTK
jgi:fused signal recognition particle receptor